MSEINPEIPDAEPIGACEIVTCPCETNKDLKFVECNELWSYGICQFTHSSSPPPP